MSPAARLLLRVGLVGLALVAVGASALVACDRRPVQPPPPRGVLLFCVDTLRGDGLAPAGEPDAPMPALVRFAAGGTTFADASAACSWTSPSVTSLLTGLRPSHHGVDSFTRNAPLIHAVTTLAEMLQAAGWSTHACTGGGWVSPERGLGQGFDEFHVTFDEQGPEAAVAAWDRARAKDRPFFLFLHTYVAHDPYGHRAWMVHGEGGLHAAATLAPADLAAGLERGHGHVPDDLMTPYVLQHLTNPLGRRACMQALGGPRYGALWGDAIGWLGGGYAALPERTSIETSLRASYRAGLSSADEVFADTLAALDRVGVLARTDVVFVGDHGEAFGEHRTLGHGLNLYDELLRVPLVVRAPARLPPGKVVHGSCSLMDVAPTILELGGVPVPPGLDGRSLVALAAGAESGRPVVAELDRAASPKDAMGAKYHFLSVRTAAAKWVLWYDPADGRVFREELFDLASDPGEQSSLPLADGIPARFGADFCRAVDGERDAARRLAGLAPDPRPCTGSR